MKLKFLYGLGAGNLQFDNLKYTSGVDKWTLDMDSKVNYAIPDIQNAGVTSLLKPSGLGLGLDLGVDYRPLEKLKIGAAITDLGSIKWKNNPYNYGIEINHTLTRILDFKIENLINEIDPNSVTDSLITDFLASVKDTVTYNAFRTPLSPRINLSGEYAILNTLTVGLLSTATINKKSIFLSLTPSINYRPYDEFSPFLFSIKWEGSQYRCWTWVESRIYKCVYYSRLYTVKLYITSHTIFSKFFKYPIGGYFIRNEGNFQTPC
jgi:hypothetical protein